MDTPELVDDVSIKMRDYLVEVYRLSERLLREGDYVSTSALADLLMVTPPAVNRMINRLRQQGLIEHAPYQGIRLTDEGKREARVRLRAHRIAESFLVNVMGLGWEEVFYEAQRMSAGLTDMLLARMDEMAGRPQFCPHGEPIPALDGEIAPLNDFLLVNAPIGTPLIVSRVQTREADRLHYIKALGLTPGVLLQVHHCAPFSGPIQLKLRDEYRIIGHNLAEQIRVKSPNAE
ncbi:MAG: metal-dependent transcriptional regulator [Chloroflexi bacterium]|nr:metal-dependent transcriptional regulator [Chloroflexota bacterium]